MLGASDVKLIARPRTQEVAMWANEYSAETSAAPESADRLGPQVGAEISAEFPQTVGGLVARAES
jgi:hypothetical protein